MRTIRFRAWIPTDYRGNPYMFYQGDQYLQSFLKRCVFMSNDHGRDHEKYGHYELEQFTGKLGFNNRELYEGDIVFYEEAEEDGDRRYYLVIIWIAEWSMFASLHIDEYKKFLLEGAEALDEVMFWTYTLQKSENFHYAGNIHENPELL